MTDNSLPEEPLSGAIPLVGRKKEITAIKHAIRDAGSKRVLYFVSGGGMGKTRILEEIVEIRKRGCLPIIDLYHQKNHSPSGLRYAIVHALGEKYFPKYTKQRLAFEVRRDIGQGGKALEEMRLELDKIFVEEYNEVSAKRRLILRFDTLELIQYEHDSVQTTCLVDDVDTIVKNWLLRTIPQLENTVTIFAGRPSGRTELEFQNKFSQQDCLFERHELPALTKLESDLFIQHLCEKYPEPLQEIFSSENPPDIYPISEGKPIRLAIIVDLLRFEQPLNVNLPKEKIDAQLVERLMQLPEPIGTTIQWLLQARKGLDKNLLQHLWGTSTVDGFDIDTILHQMSNLIVTKTYQGDSSRLFLHDELYDLHDRYFFNDSGYRREFFQGPQGYYQNKLAIALAQNAEGVEESRDLATQIEDIKLSLLYYALQCEPDSAYKHYYIRWDEEAIKKHETGFDMRLRDEVLRFYNRYAFDKQSPFYDPFVADLAKAESIHRDCAVRWVKRHIARGAFSKADMAAQNVYKNKDKLFDWNMVDDPIYKAGLLTAWSEALLYIASTEEREILNKLNEVFELLPDSHQTSMELSLEVDDETWLKKQILGKAYNNRGYLHRTHGRYGQAYIDYRHALRYFRQIHDDERANTLTNLAYIMALLGRVDTAKHHITEAIDIRKKWDQRQRYTMALSINTDGLVDTYAGRPDLGSEMCREALQICTEVNEPRGVGMACNALGLALRRQGEQWKMNPRIQAESYFHEAKETLQRAIDIFTESVPEPTRLWEAYNEMGSLYCDWANLVRQDRSRWLDACPHYETSIRYQEQALQVAKQNNFSYQIADSHDDLAQAKRDYSFLLYAMNDYDKAEKYRHEAEALLKVIENELIPAQYRLENLHNKQLEAGTAYWQSLGKVYLQRGIWELYKLEGRQMSFDNRQDVSRKSVRFFAISSAYFQRYWPQSNSLQQTLRAFTRRLAKLGISPTMAHNVINEVETTYGVDLRILQETVDDTLGI